MGLKTHYKIDNTKGLVNSCGVYYAVCMNEAGYFGSAQRLNLNERDWGAGGGGGASRGMQARYLIYC